MDDKWKQLSTKQLRKIIHIDMDCFYAAVEMRDNPHFQNVPLAVGGTPEARGTLCTCNYEARKYGVRSAMSSRYALKLCPQLLILPVNFAKYREASEGIHKILREYSELVEPLSLDEAFLDVTDSEYKSATFIAQAIREKIWTNLHLTASAGVAPNKFLAKVASDWHKPNGLFVIPPAHIHQFMLTLPIEKIPGVGKVTAKKMNEKGLRVCGDIQQQSEKFLHEEFGKWGREIYQMAYGFDERPVITEWERKSLSVEHTFPQDLHSLEECQQQIPILVEGLLKRCERWQYKENIVGIERIRNFFIKIKYFDFKIRTMEINFLSLSTCNAMSSLLTADYLSLLGHYLLRAMYTKRPASIRLLGIGFRLQDNEIIQNEKERKKAGDYQLQLPFDI